MDALTLLLLILSVLSHVGMSIFFAKLRYNKLVTSLIWLVYAVVFLILPPTTPKLNYTLMVLLNAVLFFIATKGKPIEKGFLFISYASIYTAFGAFAAFIAEKEMHIAAKIVFMVLIMGILQVLIYVLILPKFKKVSVYIDKGFGKYYAIVIAFLLVMATQTIYIDGVTRTDNGRFQIFIATTAMFFVTYAALFSSLKDMVELAKENDVVFCHENESEIYGQMPAEVRDILENVDGLGGIFDPANYRMNNADIMEGIKATLINFKYMHIKDAIYERQAIVPAGEGEGMIGEVIDIINENTDNLVYLTLEPHLFAFLAYKQIDNHELKGNYTFENGREAFDFAVKALENLLTKHGYRKDSEGIWKK